MRLADIITPVLCRRYGILFPHDFSEAGPKDYEKVKEKYDRRIQKLKDSISNPIPKVFVFHIGHPNDWQLEQYRLAGLKFIESSKEEVNLLFKDLSIRNSELVPLEKLKPYKMNLVQGGKHILSQLKQVFRKKDSGGNT